MFWRRDFRENDKSGYHVFGEDPNIPVLKKVTIYVFNKGNERCISLNFFKIILSGMFIIIYISFILFKKINILIIFE